MANKILVNTIGFTIEIDMISSIAGATNLALSVKKPDNTIVTWTPEIYGSTKFRYVTLLGDLDKPGNYIIHPSFTLGGWSGLGDPVNFRVYDLFE